MRNENVRLDFLLKNLHLVLINTLTLIYIYTHTPSLSDGHRHIKQTEALKAPQVTQPQSQVILRRLKYASDPSRLPLLSVASQSQAVVEREMQGA